MQINPRNESIIADPMRGLIANPTLPVAHDDGSFISERVSKLVEVIRERWPMLDVKWIPYHMRGAEEPAFLIVEKLPDGREVPVFHVQDEKSFDGSVLERIIRSDNKNGTVLSDIEAQNEAARLLVRKEYNERLAESHEMARAVLKSPKSKYKINNEITIRDYGNRRR